MEHTKKSVEQKIIAYCDINDITNLATWIDYSRIVESLQNTITNLVTWNTQDFLAIGIWKMIRENLSDEDFFQIGDITSGVVLKQSRPFLDAFDKLQEHIQENTLYVLDNIVTIAFIHSYGQDSYDLVLKNIAKKNSRIYLVDII